MKKYNYIFWAIIFICIASCQKKNIRINTEASLQKEDQLPENPLLLHALTVSVQAKDSLLSTLYANDIAYSYALKHLDGKYPNGSILYEVTWREQADAQWFGANIPQKMIQVERILFEENGQMKYYLYSGTPIRFMRSEHNNPRIAEITQQPMAMVP